MVRSGHADVGRGRRSAHDELVGRVKPVLLLLQASIILLLGVACGQTWPMCCSPARPPVGASWPFAQRLAGPGSA